ncbi:MAG: ADP-ribosylglycohydrolase family protein [archaeon]
MIEGMGIGDAAAAPYEHLSRNQIEDMLDLTGYPERPGDRSMRFPGKYTDDTQMAVAVAELLYSGKEFNRDNLTSHIYKAYHRDKRPGYSKYTTEALESPTTEEYMANIKHSDRNGAIPRNVPIGVLRNTENVINYAIINSELDHNTPQSITSSVFVALASHYMFHELGKPQNIYRFCIDKMREYHAESAFDEDTIEYLRCVSLMDEVDENLLFGANSISHGVPVDAKRTAGAVLYILTNHSDEAYETLEESILLGGDTDTVAATCLGMVASWKGLEGLPKSLIDNFEDGEYGIKYLRDTGKKLATILPIELENFERRDRPELRKYKLTHGLDGIMQPIDMIYMVELMKRQMEMVPYKPGDYILGIESTGYFAAAAAALATGLKLVSAKKTDLVVPEDINVIRFEEPSSPREKLFIYGLSPGDRVIIIDDEIRTAKTSENLYHALSEQGIEVVAIVNPIESLRYGANEKIKNLGFDLISHTKHNLP